MSAQRKQVKLAVIARVVIFGKVQTDKDGISHCEIRIPNFSMCHKLLQNFVEKLQQLLVPIGNANSGTNNSGQEYCILV